MGTQNWIQQLEALGTKVKHRLLDGVFRRVLSLRDAFMSSLQVAHKEPPAQQASEQVIIRDEHQVRILTAGELILDKTYGELVAPLLLLPQEIPPGQSKSAIENLPWVQQGSPRAFPLDLYWHQIRMGMSGANAWLHCCVGSRQTALDIFLPLPAEPSSHDVEEQVSFILSCSSNSPATRGLNGSASH